MLKQLQKCQSFVTILSVLIHVDGFQLPFHIKHSGKTNITAQEGEIFEYTCSTRDHILKYCVAEHANSGSKWTQVVDCDVYQNRTKCKQQIQNSEIEKNWIEKDWTCVRNNNQTTARYTQQKLDG